MLEFHSKIDKGPLEVKQAIAGLKRGRTILITK